MRFVVLAGDRQRGDGVEAEDVRHPERVEAQCLDPRRLVQQPVERRLGSLGCSRHDSNPHPDLRVRFVDL
jgi:hypothetical protein